MNYQVTYRKAAKALRAAGWVEIRCKGDHHQFKHPEKGLVFTLPGAGGQCLSPNVTKALEKVLGLPRKR